MESFDVLLLLLAPGEVQVGLRFDQSQFLGLQEQLLVLLHLLQSGTQ